MYRPPVVDYRRLRRITEIPEDKDGLNTATIICILCMALGAIVLFKRYRDKHYQSPRSAGTLWM